MNTETSIMMMETEVRKALNKLQRLAEIIPQDDPRAIKAKKDFIAMNEQFSDIMFAESEQFAEKKDSDESDADFEQKMKKLELKTKKLMTVTKSKYFMLKANFP